MPIEQQQSPVDIDHVIQYLNWALVCAHRIAHPDCSKVVVECHLDRTSTTTSYVMKDKPKEN